MPFIAGCLDVHNTGVQVAPVQCEAAPNRRHATSIRAIELGNCPTVKQFGLNCRGACRTCADTTRNSAEIGCCWCSSQRKKGASGKEICETLHRWRSMTSKFGKLCGSFKRCAAREGVSPATSISFLCQGSRQWPWIMLAPSASHLITFGILFFLSSLSSREALHYSALLCIALPWAWSGHRSNAVNRGNQELSNLGEKLRCG